MDTPEKIIELCEKYINKEIDVKSFQKNLEIIFLSDEYKNSLEIAQHNAHNMLEKILFGYLLEDQRSHAVVVAEELISFSRKCIVEKSDL